MSRINDTSLSARYVSIRLIGDANEAEREVVGSGSDEDSLYTYQDLRGFGNRINTCKNQQYHNVDQGHHEHPNSD